MSYRTIVADPPWEYPEGFVSVWPEGQSRGGEVAVRELPYSSMTVAAIADLPVRNLATKDARLFLWTTNRFLPEAFSVLESWGARYRQTLVWHKTNPSPLGGSVAPNSCEYVLVATWGNPKRLGRAKSSVVTCPRVKESFCDSRENHSRKPEVFLDLIECVSGGPYLELFSRRNRLGWDTWGDEALEHVEMAS